MSKTLLIVAHYKESLDWVKHLPLHVTPLVVTKGEHLPNEGREAGSYFWAFQNHPVEDDDTVFCVQGDPFVHCPTLIRSLYQSPSRFLPLGNWEVECDGNGSPHHTGLPVAQKYEEWFERDWPGKIGFTAGGQFVVTGKELKEHDWEQWYERSKEEYGPWLIERFWQELFAQGAEV